MLAMESKSNIAAMWLDPACAYRDMCLYTQQKCVVAIRIVDMTAPRDSAVPGRI
jgi:hypothetical protein